MAAMEFASTNLPHNISHGLYHEKGYDVGEGHVDKLYYIIMFGAANILKENKSMETPATFVITNIKNKPIAAATVQYFKNEDENNPGNWSLTWTFDPNDIPENAEIYDLHNDDIHHHFRLIAGQKWGMKFYDRTSIIVLISYSMEQLYKWLDENAKEGETVEIELDGVFNAKVEIVDGVKKFAIIPAGEVKTIIKDDTSIEK